MAEMVWSAVIQETVSRGVSFVLGKREEKTSQGHIMERLEEAVSDLEYALERSAKMPITDVSLIQRRKVIKGYYIEATELLSKHKQQALPAASQEDNSQGVKRKRWMIVPAKKNLPLASSITGLKMDEVRRFERLADRARNFVRDVESGCSLWHYTFCSPIVKYLLDGKKLEYYTLKQGNKVRHFSIWPTFSAQCGVQAMLEYCCKDSTSAEKSFMLSLSVRLSESTDIVGVAIKALQLLLASQLKLAAESAVGEIGLLHDLLADVAHSYKDPWVRNEEVHSRVIQIFRPDPACCKVRRHGLGGNNDVSSESLHMFPEEVYYFWFVSYIPALEPRLRLRSSSSSSTEAAGRSSISSRGWMPPLMVSACFMPHDVNLDSYTIEAIGNSAGERREASIQEVAMTIKSRAINCLERHPKVTEYEMTCYSKHGWAIFEVAKTRRRCNSSPDFSLARRLWQRAGM